ncbi:RRQRL motif-containing zinc-binding protein [Streptomyces sp. URMC 129]|uniref:RRQRL motif-containing zinc-binding protein n=1 Tax=Streptomyces sp. URMC 129 TaxID=3423407 RepID=UPI003F1B9662
MSALPTYRPRLAPDGLMTRRQLRAAGLRPNGHPPVARIVWTRSKRWADLFDVSKAAPIRPMTDGRRRTLDAMMRARRTCPDCGLDRGYCLPRRYGCCPYCAGVMA